MRRRRAGPAVYELTEWGRELHPILLMLGRWGARSSRRPAGKLGVDALMIALESTFVAERSAGLRARYELRLGEERFAVEVEDGAIAVSRGAPRRPDAVIETDPATLRAVAFGDRPLAGAPVETRGDIPLAQAFFRLFARPAPAGPDAESRGR